jgi:AcrR family transcriptional regulator
MARQVRSEVTRRKILDAAVDVFGEVGYAAAGWGTIVERTGMAKGALYHHFDAKEPLAAAIIEEGSETLLGAFRGACGSASPAFENMIHGTFAVANILSTDKMACGAEQLAAALSGFNEAASHFYANWVAEMTAEARRAIAEGDLREDLDPEMISKSIVGAMFGMRLLANAIAGDAVNEGPVGQLSERLYQIWELLLPGIASEASLPYLRQFLAREAIRHTRSDVARTDTGAASETLARRVYPHTRRIPGKISITYRKNAYCCSGVPEVCGQVIAPADPSLRTAHSTSCWDARLVPVTSFRSVDFGRRLVAREHARRGWQRRSRGQPSANGSESSLLVGLTEQV